MLEAPRKRAQLKSRREQGSLCMVEEAGWAGTRRAIRIRTGKALDIAVIAARFASAIRGKQDGLACAVGTGILTRSDERSPQVTTKPSQRSPVGDAAGQPSEIAGG